MMRAVSHVGLALALLAAPALCCCNLRWLAATASEPAPRPAPPPKSSCCKTWCCHEVETEPNQPAPPKEPWTCCCTAARPVAAHTEATPDIPAPEFTGQLAASPALAPVLPEHADLARATDPPERAGVDARSAALFDRHVMRC